MSDNVRPALQSSNAPAPALQSSNAPAPAPQSQNAPASELQPTPAPTATANPDLYYKERIFVVGLIIVSVIMLIVDYNQHTSTAQPQLKTVEEPKRPSEYEAEYEARKRPGECEEPKRPSEYEARIKAADDCYREGDKAEFKRHLKEAHVPELAGEAFVWWNYPQSWFYKY